MIVENPENYKLIDFVKSNTKHKKYDAIIENKITKRTKRIPFGDIRYQHYKDSTNKKLYSYLDHGEKRRRELYRLRHKNEYTKKFSSGYFSWYYLW